MLIPKNDNILVEPIRNAAKSVFSESDSRKDLQYATVLAVTKGSELPLKTRIVYNPRNLTKVVHDGKALGFLHENHVIAYDI